MISLIQNTETFIEPKIELEQYSIDAVCAVDIVYYAGFEHKNIENSIVFDLGAGTGRLSIASAFLKAYYVISIDVDLNALKILEKNIKSLDLDHVIFPINADIESIEISTRNIPENVKITTLMNPPFGVQKKTADRPFLAKAFSFSDVVYSIHLAGEKIRNFITNYIKRFNWKIDKILPFTLLLEKSFQFHTQKIRKIDVSVYRFIKKEKK